MNKSGKTILALVLIAAAVFGVIYGAITLTNNIGRDPGEVGAEKAAQSLDKLYRNIPVNTPTPIKGNAGLLTSDPKDDLPGIDKYPPSVKENKDSLFVEIFSSPEKAGTGTDGWLCEVAEAFNKSGAKIGGKPVSVRLRSVSSGLAADYISTGKYVPDALTPSNELWGEMLTAKGIKVDMIGKSMNGNVPGVLFSTAKQQEMVSKYGAVNMSTISKAVRDGDLTMGYTNPFASSTGLNYLLCTLMTFDQKDPLSEKAVQGFMDFSLNVPFVAYNTLQMREAAERGVLDGFVMEYQSYANMPSIKAGYTFTPFGVRHDSPLYAIGKISDEKKELLKLFYDFCRKDEWQNLATEYGFNALPDYKFEMQEPKGAVIAQAQKLWKENKNSGQSITAVFVADVSGSMQGEPLSRLKTSLISGAKYIGSENNVGLVTFSTNVSIALPIAKFDLNQQSLLVGTVESMQANGNTAMFEAIVVGLKMLTEAKEKDPDTKPLLFVLTDGAANGELDYSDTQSVIKSIGIPVYTIGYNVSEPVIAVLRNISGLNEAAQINADSDDVVYQLGSLFNAQM